MEETAASGGADGGLTEEQRRAVELVAEGVRDGEIARRLGVRASLVGVWRRYDAEFRLAVRERRRGLEGVRDGVMEEEEGPVSLQAPTEEGPRQRGAATQEPPEGDRARAELVASSVNEMPRDDAPQEVSPPAAAIVTTRMASFS